MTFQSWSMIHGRRRNNRLNLVRYLFVDVHRMIKYLIRDTENESEEKAYLLTP